MALVILAGVLALQAWTWRRLSGRVSSGQLSRLQAAVRYGLWALVPLLVFVGAFFGAVGLEEWLGVALLPESMARATLLIVGFLLGLAGLGSACFGVRCVLIQRAPRIVAEG